MKTVLVAVLLFASSAAAETPTVELVPTCVAIDDTRDQLPESQRETARMLLVRVLEQADQLIVETGCTTTIELSHERQGDLVHVRVGTTLAEESMRVTTRADMRATYKALVTALFVPPPPIVEAPVEIEAMPTRYTGLAFAESPPGGDVHVRQIYTKLGIASLAGKSGSSFSFGWRRGYGVALDLGIAIVNAGDNGDTASSVSMRVQALKYSSPADSSSGYWGGGISLGGTNVQDQMSEEAGGLQLEATIGYEWNRRGTLPVSVEGSAGLPIYMVGNTYPATFVASFGVAM